MHFITFSFILVVHYPQISLANLNNAKFSFFLAGQNDALSAALSPPRSRNPSNSVDHDAANEEELDLLYDPCLNCYFDPRTHKYYELA